MHDGRVWNIPCVHRFVGNSSIYVTIGYSEEFLSMRRSNDGLLSDRSLGQKAAGSQVLALGAIFKQDCNTFEKFEIIVSLNE